MATVVLLSIFVYALVCGKSVLFFRQGGHCRESDKTIVASLGIGSVLFILGQVVVWGTNPFGLIHGSLGLSLLMAFNFFNAFFYLALITSLTERKACHSLPHG